MVFRIAAGVTCDHNVIAWQQSTGADTSLRDIREALAEAKMAVQLAPNEGNYWNTLGVVQYRAGDWNAALAALEKSMTLRKGGDSGDWFFVAMVHWQLGRKDEARRWFDQAVQWMEKNKPQDEELERFRAEAKALIDP